MTDFFQPAGHPSLAPTSATSTLPASTLPSRASGVLLHPTSLAGPHGIGTLGAEAHAFADWLAAAGQRLWQVLPLGPTGYGDSPYSALSAFAGNTNLIDLDVLVQQGLLAPESLQAHMPPPEVYAPNPPENSHWRSERLAEAFAHFKAGHAQDAAALAQAFADFKQQQAGWLGDYALFTAIKAAEGGAAWQAWPAELRQRDAAALQAFAKANADALEQVRFAQFLFQQQWQALRTYAAQRGIQIVGDLPIFVALDSADAWANQSLFLLDADGQPTVQAGVPPDYFSAEGQLWGNPLYNWPAMQAQGFAWWKARFERCTELFDFIRVDHFRGFQAYWEVPFPAPNAVGGRWVEAAGAEMLRAVRHHLGHLPILAEDLGVITPEVEKLRDDFGLPGMAVLQFAFGDSNFRASPFLPPNIVPNRVAYTGTHDNDTTRGWWLAAGEAERWHLQEFVGHEVNGATVAWTLLELAWKSPARVAIAPLQDLLNLGSEARMNVPGTADGNWRWRLAAGSLTPELAARLRALTQQAGRLVQ